MHTRFRHTLACFALALMLGGIGAVPSFAQSRVEVSGVITDTTDVGLPGATAVLLQQADSVMVSFGVTKGDGAFRLRRVPAGDYLLQVTFVGLEPLMHPVTVADANVDVGRLMLQEAVSEIGTLVISADRIPMSMSSDTLIYNADAFGAPPNSSVEDLLKRLPGMEVERDGSIKANGEEVQQVLVDGKEFFGNDPRIATRNLPADAVDQVQVFDKQSEMAEFTGVDDGEEARTLNLKLKEDRRKGYFGNVSGGYGRDIDGDRYEGKASINRFSPTTQLSLLSNFNNINAQAFSPMQMLQMSGGLEELAAGGGGVITLGNVAGLGGMGGSDGISSTSMIGLNANREFGSKTDIRSSYFYNGVDNVLNETRLQRQLAGSAISAETEQVQARNTENANHRLNLNALHKIADGHDVRFRGNLNATNRSSLSNDTRSTMGADGLLANSSTSAYTSDGNDWGGEGRLTYRKRFGSRGTSLVADLRSRFTTGDSDARLDANNRFFELGNVLTNEELAQLQEQASDRLSNRAQLSLTHPFTKRLSLQLRGEYRTINEDRSKTFFDQVGSDLVRNDLLSSALDRTFAYTQGGAVARWNSDKLSGSIGATLQQSQLDGTLGDASTAIDRQFTHVLPSASVQYAVADGANLRARYRTSTREPSMRELQPFTDNTNPVNLYTGNPQLTPEYRHSGSLSFNFYDTFTFTNFFAFLNATHTTNSITRARTVDDQFRQISTSLNAGSAWTLNGNLNFGTPIRPLGLRVGISNNMVYNRGLEIINDAENQANLLRNTVGLRLENRNKEVFDVMAGTRLAFNVTRYSLNPGLDQNYLNRTFYASAAVDLGKGWRISTELDYQAYAEEVFGEGQRVALWEAKISRTMLRERATLELVGLDLLDQNVGIDFRNQPTFIEETRMNALGRYLMLRFVYNLSANGRSGQGISIFGG
ncbi:MAG: TonB-dependent receptor [Bacteroidota bacterium]